MAASFTYATLVTAIETFTEDSGTEFVTAIDTIIPLAESRLLRDLDLELFDVTASGTFTASSAVVTKPTDMVALRSFHYTDASGNFQMLDPKSWEFVKDYWPKVATTTATPKYFTEYSDTQWYLAGTPASGLTYTVRYIKRPTGLTSGNTTSWLGTHVGDVLLYACLITSEQFLKADDRMPLWKTEYAAHLNAAKKELRRTDRNDYSPIESTPDAK